MDRGIYAASSGGVRAARKLDVVGHNLANVNTVGFKAERLVSRQQEFADTLAGVTAGVAKRAASDQEVTPGVVDISTMTDFTVGPINQTGNPLNVAIAKDKQFFSIQTKEGEAYTKAGNFTLDSQGNLVTQDGLPVVGEGGPITISGSAVNISENGSVFVDGERAGKLKIVEFQDLTQLKRAEGTRFFTQGGAQPQTVDNPDLMTSAVEMSNTGVVESMVDMIAASKSFEAYSKVAQTINELNEISTRTPRSVG